LGGEDRESQSPPKEILHAVLEEGLPNSSAFFAQFVIFLGLSSFSLGRSVVGDNFFGELIKKPIP